MNREVCEHFVPTDQLCPDCLPCSQEPLLLYSQSDLDAAVAKYQAVVDAARELDAIFREKGDCTEFQVAAGWVMNAVRKLKEEDTP